MYNLAEIKEKCSTGQICEDVCGRVKYVKPIKQCKSSEFLLSFIVFDETNTNLTVNYFLRNRHQFPKVEPNTVVILLYTKISLWRGNFQCTIHSSDSCVTDVKSYVEARQSNKALSKRYQTVSSASDNGVNIYQKSFKDIDGSFLYCDIVCKILNVSAFEDKFCLILWDGTENDSFETNFHSKPKKGCCVQLLVPQLNQVFATDVWISIRNVNVAISDSKLKLYHTSWTAYAVATEPKEQGNDKKRKRESVRISVIPKTLEAIKQWTTLIEVDQGNCLIGVFKVRDVIVTNYYPKNIKEFTRPLCILCNENLVDSRANKSPKEYNLQCGFCSTRKSNLSPTLNYSFAFKLILKDSTLNSLEVLLHGSDAVEFLMAEPDNLFENNALLEKIKRRIHLLGSTQLDSISLKSYVTLKNERKIQIFDTRCFFEEIS